MKRESSAIILSVLGGLTKLCVALVFLTAPVIYLFDDVGPLVAYVLLFYTPMLSAVVYFAFKDLLSDRSSTTRYPSRQDFDEMESDTTD